MKILGYSERGIINSLIFNIGEDMELMSKFIELIGIPDFDDLDKPINYEILLEQSFSDFGDADLVIIIKYENPKHKRVLFIEGKVKTYLKKHWSLEKQFKYYNKEDKYNGFSSNLFFQLYLKSLLIKSRNKISKKRESIIPARFRGRKIGKNKIVWKAFKKLLKCEQAYYIGLIPSTEKEIDDFKLDNDTGLHFLSWKKVEKFCNENKLKKVEDIFDYNDKQIY